MMNLWQTIRTAIAQVIELIRPPRAFAWQTSIWLSIFSWVMSVLSQADGLTSLLMNLAWFFLIVGVNWALLENPFRLFGVSLGPWITGALLCLFTFDRPINQYWQIAVISWPLFSAVIAAVPTFLSRELRLQLPTRAGRQSLVLLFLVNALLSCWLQFYFRVQDWLISYPSFLADDFSHSAFVVYLGEEAGPSQGVALMTALETAIATEIRDQPWSGVERWLLGLEQIHLPAIVALVKDQVPLQAETEFWQFGSEINSLADASTAYRLTLRVRWVGPHAGTESYLFEQTCQVRPTNNLVTTNFSEATSVTPQAVSSTRLTEINCGTIERQPFALPIEGEPPTS